MNSIFWRGNDAPPATHLKTRQFVKSVNAQLQSYVDAPDRPGREAALEATRHLFVQFETRKSYGEALHPQRLGRALSLRSSILWRANWRRLMSTRPRPLNPFLSSCRHP